MKPRNLSKQMPNSESAFERAKKSLIGGVNSPVRAFGSVEGSPLFIQSGKGAWITDVDGNQYIDYRTILLKRLFRIVSQFYCGMIF